MNLTEPCKSTERRGRTYGSVALLELVFGLEGPIDGDVVVAELVGGWQVVSDGHIVGDWHSVDSLGQEGEGEGREREELHLDRGCSCV